MYSSSSLVKQSSGVVTVVAKAAIASIRPAEQKVEHAQEPPRRIGLPAYP